MNHFWWHLQFYSFHFDIWQWFKLKFGDFKVVYNASFIVQKCWCKLWWASNCVVYKNEVESDYLIKNHSYIRTPPRLPDSKWNECFGSTWKEKRAKPHSHAVLGSGTWPGNLPSVVKPDDSAESWFRWCPWRCSCWKHRGGLSLSQYGFCQVDLILYQSIIQSNHLC